MNEVTDDDAVFKALGHRARRTILDALKAGPLTTSALCDHLPDLSRYAVMQHLGVLESAGLVIVERKGRERWNHFNAIPIAMIHERWIGPYAAFAASKLAGLEDHFASSETDDESGDNRNGAPNL